MARLATTNPAGEIDLVPITFALLDEDLLVTAVDHKPKSSVALQRLANVRAHPDVTVLVDHYEDDWDRLWWVRLRGTAEVVERGDLYERAVAALVDRYGQYRHRPPRDAVIAVRIRSWRGWAAAG